MSERPWATAEQTAEFERVKVIKDCHSADLMSLPNVVGVGVGMLCDDYIIRVFLRDDQVWPGPWNLDGVQVYIEVIGDIRAAAGPTPATGETREGE